MAPARIVVIGADAAGMSAAHQARRGAAVRHREVEVVVLERTHHTSYSACGIPYWIAGDVDDGERLLARSADQHRAMGVDLRMGATATELDLRRRQVHYRYDGRDEQVPFDHLVLATGAPAIVPHWARSATAPGSAGCIRSRTSTTAPPGSTCSRPPARRDDRPSWSAAVTSVSRWPRRSCAAAGTPPC